MAQAEGSGPLKKKSVVVVVVVLVVLFDSFSKNQQSCYFNPGLKMYMHN